jgi:uncharacterized protein
MHFLMPIFACYICPMNEKYELGQKVELIILRETNLGFVAEINGIDEGLLYHNEVFERLTRGQAVSGYIGKIRPDGGIDLLLQPFGNFGAEELGNKILEVLKQNNGVLPINAKSAAEKIYDTFGVSRKKFKIALGGLYKKRLVQFTESGTTLVSK